MPEVEPILPREAGVDEQPPDAMQVEGAQLLGAHARPRLKEQGFTDDQIDRWADAFVREEGAGDVEGFLRWVGRQQQD